MSQTQSVTHVTCLIGLVRPPLSRSIGHNIWIQVMPQARSHGTLKHTQRAYGQILDINWRENRFDKWALYSINNRVNTFMCIHNWGTLVKQDKRPWRKTIWQRMCWMIFVSKTSPVATVLISLDWPILVGTHTKIMKTNTYFCNEWVMSLVCVCEAGSWNIIERKKNLSSDR